MRSVFVITLVLAFSVVFAEAQDTWASGCEENEARLDGIVAKWSPQPGITSGEPGITKTLIIIAHPGSGEYSRNIMRHRLHNAREYLLYRKPAERKNIIVAEGEKRVGLGSVAFYLDGEVIDELFVKKNKSLCVDCCENNLIPPYKKWPR